MIADNVRRLKLANHASVTLTLEVGRARVLWNSPTRLEENAVTRYNFLVWLEYFLWKDSPRVLPKSKWRMESLC